MDDKTMSGAVMGVVSGLIFLAFAGMEQAFLGTLTDEAIVDFILHIVVSGAIGIIYTMFVAKMNSGGLMTVVTGIIAGIALWIVVGQIINPVIGGGDVLDINLAAGGGLYAYVTFGIVHAWLDETHGGDGG